MNRALPTGIVFEDRHLVAVEEGAGAPLLRPPPGSGHSVTQIDAMGTCHLVALLESLCLRELREYLDADAQVVVGNAIHCERRAPILSGALLRIGGWAEVVDEREVTFRVQAHDELEQVCDGTVRLVFACRGEARRRLERKRAAIARREQFLGA